jgi:diguanylate cyclase (GGDEF)-like protein/PAS domain S-box-containing protein
MATLWIPSGLTAAAFVGLYRVDLVGDLPLAVLLSLLVAAAVSGEITGRRLHPQMSARFLQCAMAVQVLGVTAIIYAIGWGPTLAIGYVFVLERAIEEVGSRAWRPTLAWSVVGIGVGQAAVATGIVPSYVRSPYVHGLGVLSVLGTGFVMQLLGSKTRQQERSQADLVAGEASFRQLFADNPQPMWVYDTETLAFVEVNDAAVHHYGYGRDEFLMRRITDIRPDDDVPRLLATVQDRDQPFQESGEWRHQLKDGRRIDVEVSSHRLMFAHRPAVLVAIQDVTQRNALECELRHQAFHDSLTGLANRALFIDRVDHAIRRHDRDDQLSAVLLLDLDGFKTVNDSLGHTIGDQLLIDVARRLEATLRQADTAARLGGDEFAVLLEDLDLAEEASDASQRIIDALAAPFCLAGKEIFVHASIGITIAGLDGQDAEALVRNADTAMYRAKSAGKACYRLFEPAMHVAAVARLELEADLRRAVSNNAFVVHYQPIYAIDTHRVVSVEALVRWQHPTRGLIQPAEFIPVAEETGLIVDIGRLVFDAVCSQARQWRDNGHRDFTVAVNLSRRQLADANLVHDIITALADNRLDPTLLVLEITESVLLEEPDIAVGRLHQLRTAGIRIAIDDFGTGYSSLSSLRSLPVDELKIDKSFIDNIATNADAAGVVHAILRLARTLQLDTVAEGVEHHDQLHELAALGCRHVQGFHFSKAVPAADVAALLRAQPAAPATRTS